MITHNGTVISDIEIPRGTESVTMPDSGELITMPVEIDLDGNRSAIWPTERPLPVWAIGAKA